MKKYFILSLITTIFITCNPPIQKRTLDLEQVERLPIAGKMKAGQGQQCCKEYDSYLPDTNYLDHTPMRYMRLNFHIMNSTDSSRNFTPAAGTKYIKSLIGEAHKKIRNNKKMLLPVGNNTAVYPPRYRYVLTPRPNAKGDDGIYFHYDDDLCYYVVKGRNRNNHKKDVIKKYGIQIDTVFNVFMIPHHPDSLKSPYYGGYDAGIALGNSLKLTGAFVNKTKPWVMQKYLNHELGHNLGLRHTWFGRDDCEDTPKHPNCWSLKSPSPCDSMASNNFMDYNAYQNAWTPCQIGKMHYNMAREKHKSRKLLKPTWCELKEKSHIIIRDSIHWKSMKDLEGNLTIEAGAILKMSCRTSLPKGAKITVKPGAKLILDNCKLHNACGDSWKGIEIQSWKKLKGEVVVVGEPVIENLE